MKKFLFGLMLLPVLALAQEVVPPSSAEISDLLASLGGLKGMGVLGIVAIVVQILMLVLRSQMGALLGKYRLVAVLFFSLVGGVFALHMQGVSFGAALVHASSLAAAQVLLHQIYSQFIEKKPV